MAINKQMQKACPRLLDLVGHSQIEAERLQNQPGSFLGCSEAIWYRSLMLHGRLPEAPGCSWDAPGYFRDAPGPPPGRLEGCKTAWVMCQEAPKIIAA